MAEAGNGNDPFSTSSFLVEIENVTVTGFSECSGLATETDVIDCRNGDVDIPVRKLPALGKYTIITLKRGFTDSKELWEWHETVIEVKTKRKSGCIVLLNEVCEEALRWNFREGWPSKWEGPSLNAKDNEVAIETLESDYFSSYVES